EPAVLSRLEALRGRRGTGPLPARAARFARGAASRRSPHANPRVVRPIPEAGARAHIAGAVTHHDQLRHIVEYAQDLIYYCDLAGHFTYVNPAAARVMGYSEDELLGRHFLTLIHPDHQKSAADFYRAQFAEQTSNTYFEFVAVTKDARSIWLGQH